VRWGFFGGSASADVCDSRPYATADRRGSRYVSARPGAARCDSKRCDASGMTRPGVGPLTARSGRLDLVSSSKVRYVHFGTGGEVGSTDSERGLAGVEQILSQAWVHRTCLSLRVCSDAAIATHAAPPLGRRASNQVDQNQ
jgi:hypothetical protein